MTRIAARPNNDPTLPGYVDRVMSLRLLEEARLGGRGSASPQLRCVRQSNLIQCIYLFVYWFKLGLEIAPHCKQPHVSHARKGGFTQANIVLQMIEDL